LGQSEFHWNYTAPDVEDTCSVGIALAVALCDASTLEMSLEGDSSRSPLAIYRESNPQLKMASFMGKTRVADVVGHAA